MNVDIRRFKVEHHSILSRARDADVKGHADGMECVPSQSGHDMVNVNYVVKSVNCRNLGTHDERGFVFSAALRVK